MTPASDPPFDPELPRELREALDSMTTPDPRPEFRSKLRGEFVAGEIRCSDTMVEAALADWDVPPANDDFRARCRAAFLSSAAPVPVAAGERGKLLRFLPLAAAALIAALLIPELFGKDEGWEKLGGGPIAVDGVTVSEPTAEELDRLLRVRGSCRVDRDGEKVLFRYEGGLLVEADPGTDFVVLDPKSNDTALSLELRDGALRVSAKPEFRRKVAIETLDGTFVLRGQAIGVDLMGERGTCVCCLEGEVDVDPRVEGVPDYRVGSGSSIWLPRDSDEIKLMDREVHHADSLQQIRESARTYFY
ncbi:MAG: hypothetical protein H6831_03185 [Planctomycetes bacterium]|nr:hypothetical protein [Planctomycetota bacterium]MCB9903388.1 hypothetical protein [Planctomycetota bacterium]